MPTIILKTTLIRKQKKKKKKRMAINVADLTVKYEFNKPNCIHNCIHFTRIHANGINTINNLNKKKKKKKIRE